MGKDFKRKLIIVLFYLLLAIVFILIKNNAMSHDKNNFIANNLVPIESEVENEDIEVNNDSDVEIFVHISGQVKFPGLISLTEGDRLFEAVEIAGGLSSEADIDQINLAMILKDEDKIYIPRKGEIATVYSNENKSDIVNINTGTREELMTLPGIGEKTADSIIEYRSTKRFEEIEDIMEVPGIGEGKFNQIKSKITK